MDIICNLKELRYKDKFYTSEFFKFQLGKFRTDSKKDIPKHTRCEEWRLLSVVSTTVMLSFVRHFLTILRHKIKLTFRN
jgi:hypothetical protein